MASNDKKEGGNMSRTIVTVEASVIRVGMSGGKPFAKRDLRASALATVAARNALLGQRAQTLEAIEDTITFRSMCACCDDDTDSTPICRHNATRNKSCLVVQDQRKCPRLAARS
jgi:predicted HNH restriction endonuclease